LVAGALRGGDGDLRDCSTAAFYAGVWKGKHTPQEPAQVQVPRTEASARKSLVDNSDRLNQLEGQKSQLESTLEKLKQELWLPKRKQSLSDELTTAKDKLAALTMQGRVRRSTPLRNCRKHR